MTTLDNMENQDASKKNNDRTRPDRMVKPEEQTPSAELAGEGTATHEAQRSRNPVRPGPGGRVDARQREKIDRKRDAALEILSTMLGV
jgi:hypothetical protein